MECNKCGKVNNIMHELNTAKPLYGSKLDGLTIEFYLCDDCLYEFIHSFNNPLDDIKTTNLLYEQYKNFGMFTICNEGE